MRHVIRTGQIEIARWSRGRFPCANKDARPWPSPSTPSRCRRNSRWSRHLAPGRKMFALRPHPQQRPHPRVVSCFWQWFRVSLNRWLINWNPQRLGLLTFNLILASGLPFQLRWIPLEHGTEIFRHLCGLEFHFQFACSQFLFIVFFSSFFWQESAVWIWTNDLLRSISLARLRIITSGIFYCEWGACWPLDGIRLGAWRFAGAGTQARNATEHRISDSRRVLWKYPELTPMFTLQFHINSCLIFPELAYLGN